MTEDPGRDGAVDRAEDADGDVPPPPVTFWIMIVLAVLYLGWRLIQGIIWVVERVV
jgi:hypothetical protein